MRVWTDTEQMPQFRRAVVTVGSFDGVHSGHRALLGRLVELAQSVDGESIVVTFDPHPREVLGGEKFVRLMTMEQKVERLTELGVDNLVVLPFTAELARMSQEEFVAHILVEQLGMKHFIVGYDNHFGHNREGNVDTARELGKKLGFTVEQVGQVEGVSSTLIRQGIILNS